MITDEEIRIAKSQTEYSVPGGPHHEHDDCIRIAYEWLDAQKKTQGINRKSRPLKHIIENWAGRYVSTSDVEVAAHIHPDIQGRYPHYNVSSRLVEPKSSRLSDIAEAHTQKSYKSGPNDRTYSTKE